MHRILICGKMPPVRAMPWKAALASLLMLVVFSAGQVSTDSQMKTCLHYSWLGSDSIKQFEESTLVRNGSFYLNDRTTCRDLAKPRPIPCINPYVFTDEGRVPNGSEVWQRFGNRVLCNPGEGNACVITVFFFSSEAYCSRVSMDGQALQEEGCISAKRGAYTNIVCTCDPHSDRPCNTYVPSPNGVTSFDRNDLNISTLPALLTIISLLILHMARG